MGYKTPKAPEPSSTTVLNYKPVVQSHAIRSQDNGNVIKHNVTVVFGVAIRYQGFTIIKE
jgi:hypothetical protein